MLKDPTRSVAAIVVGGSAGAIQSLLSLLPTLGTKGDVPVVTVVHLPPRRPSLLPELFSERCVLPVREPCDKEPVTSGIWFAPPDYHLLIEKDRTFSLSLDEPHLHSRPSIDALFESAADCYGNTLMGLVLSGASRDGADGVEAILKRGGRCFALTPSGLEDVSVMPAAAIEKGATALSLADIGALLGDVCGVVSTEGPSVEKHS
ncbi:MAG: chemotaxis protein CheB [Polyangiaceae bacterium]